MGDPRVRTANRSPGGDALVRAGVGGAQASRASPLWTSPRAGQSGAGHQGQSRAAKGYCWRPLRAWSPWCLRPSMFTFPIPFPWFPLGAGLSLSVSAFQSALQLALRAGRYRSPELRTAFQEAWPTAPATGTWNISKSGNVSPSRTTPTEMQVLGSHSPCLSEVTVGGETVPPAAGAHTRPPGCP